MILTQKVNKIVMLLFISSYIKIIIFPKIKKAGSLAVIVLKHLRPITLRPILSDSLPFSTL